MKAKSASRIAFPPAAAIAALLASPLVRAGHGWDGTGADNKFVLSGGITAQAGDLPTLAISQGVFNCSGDRMATQFTSAIADGSGGTLGISVDFAGAASTAHRSYANLGGQNTFTSATWPDRRVVDHCGLEFSDSPQPSRRCRVESAL
jgi:hypothetical protein